MRATRRTLADVAGSVPGVAHVEVDAEAHLDLVRALGILRTEELNALHRYDGAHRVVEQFLLLGQFEVHVSVPGRDAGNKTGSECSQKASAPGVNR